jgi:ferritin-like metal-binding protein YciE
MSAIPGKVPAVKMPPQVESARDLLLEELAKLLTVEETLVKLVLPQLVQEIEDDELKQAVQAHLEESRGHIGNVKEAFLALGTAPFGAPALGLDGLRKERESTAPKVVPALRGGINCSAAMGTEQYEINAYEAAIRLSDAVGTTEVSHLLRENLNQEVAALEKLASNADRLAQLAVEHRTVEV